MTILRKRQKLIGWVAVFTALLYLWLAGRQNSDQIAHQAKLGAQTHHALCVVKHGYIQQRAHSRQVLDTQHGAIVYIQGLHAGIDRSVLERSVQQQTIQINAMRTLEC